MVRSVLPWREAQIPELYHMGFNCGHLLENLILVKQLNLSKTHLT